MALASPAQSGVAPPRQVLPDMRQLPPSNVQVTQITGEWRIGFASQVANDGPGYLKITGNGMGDGTMVAEQDIQMSDGSETVVPGVGDMQYVVGGGHQHWHLLDFERYELRSAADPSTPIVKDQKTGFCLADAFTTDLCGRNQPNLTTVSEGISVGGRDTYLGYLEGQYLAIDPVTVPDGDYLLDNRVNPTGALAETDPSNNAASVRLSVSWSSSGTPKVEITNTCTSSIDCAPPPPAPDPGMQPQSQPQPQPDPQPSASPPADSSAPSPTHRPVPVVAPSTWGRTPALATMSRSMAGRLVRRAIAKETKQAPHHLRTTCERRAQDSFACTSRWREASARWSGHVHVWYRLREGALSWFYNLSARRRPGGKPIITRAVRGGTSRVVLADASGALLGPLR